MTQKVKNTLSLAGLFGSFMLLQFCVLWLGNRAGEGWLSVERQELVYYPTDVNAPAEIIKEGALYETTMAVAAKAIDALYHFNAATFGETFRGLKKQMVAFSKEK